MDRFAKANILGPVKVLVLIVIVGALLVAWAITGSTSWAQQPRPTLTPAPAPSEPESETQTSPSVYSGPILKGRVINLATGEPEIGVAVVFVTGGVSVEVESDENGAYAFEHLGAANGVLNVVPAQGSGLRPATADVAVRPKVGVETVVNLGVSPNGSAAPPLIPTVQLSPDYVGAGELMTITVLVKNTLPEAITDATVTNWLPARLAPVDIHSSTGNPYFSDNLAIAELGSLAAGSGALVEIVAQATGGRTAASALQGRVSFFYRESSASQTQSFGNSNGAAPVVLPVTGVGMPVIGLLLILVVLLAGWMRRRTARTAKAKR
jgi:hypothetical protein